MVLAVDQASGSTSDRRVTRWLCRSLRNGGVVDPKGLPQSFFKWTTTKGPMSQGEAIGAPYNPPPMGLDFNSLSLPQLARPGGEIQPSDLTPDGKIPAGSILQKQVTTECGYLKIPAPELHLVEANGCEVWRVQHVCTETTMEYWLLHGKSVLVGETVNRLPVTTRFIRRCPDAEPVMIPERAGSIETYVPPVDQDPDPAQTARFRQADAETTEDGVTFQIRRDVFWKLQYPLRQTGECVVMATYQLMVRTQRLAMPGGDQVGPDVISKYDPAQTQDVYFPVPGCPNEGASLPPGSSAVGGPATNGSPSVARAMAAGLIALGGVAFGIGLASYGDSTTTMVLTGTVTHVPAAPPTPTPAAPMVVGGSVCVVGQGATSLINVEVVTGSDVNEDVSGSLASAGGAPISGSGQITNGTGTIPFTITAFGSYGPFNLTGSDGTPIALGPVAGLFPFTVTSDTQPCVSAGATTPPAPPARSATPSPTVVTTTTATTTSTVSVPSWSWLGTVGALLVAAGLLVTRRRGSTGAEAAGEQDEGDPEDPEEDPIDADREMLRIDHDGYWRQNLHVKYMKNCDPAQAALVAAQEEFDAAKATLDAAEHANNAAGATPTPGTPGGKGPSTYEALTAAATRQGAARINLEVAEKRLAECLAGAEDAYRAYLSSLENEPDPAPEPPVPTDTSSRQYWDYYFSHPREWGELTDPTGTDPRPQSQPPNEPPSDEPPRIEIG